MAEPDARPARTPLTAGDAADLVRLRMFLEHALAAAADASDPGRHVALVSLDGVCEYAANLAASAHGLDTGRRHFDAALAALHDIPGWRRDGERGVRTLHRARNLAQHAGTLTDERHTSGFAAAAELFVRGLVEAAFEVELDSVLLADAVVDDGLRGKLAAGERALADGDAASGFEQAVSALADARRRWRDQQADAYGYMPASLVLDAAPDWIDHSWQVDDYADVGVFCNDLGEYHWLLATRRQAQAGVPLEADDARRALVFALDWIVRWQRFDAAYPRRRWREHFAAQRPPTTAGGGPPSIVSARVGARIRLGERLRDRVYVVVADVPEHGRGDWADDLAGVLRTVLERLGLMAGAVEAGPREPWLGELQFLVAPELDGRQTAEALRAAVETATATYAHRRDRTDERDRAASEAAAAFEAALGAVAPELFGVARGRYEMRGEGEVVVVSIALDATDAEAAEAASIFAGRGGALASARFDGAHAIDLPAFELDADGLAVLRGAAVAAAEQVAHTRRSAAEAEQERRRRQAELNDALSTPR